MRYTSSLIAISSSIQKLVINVFVVVGYHADMAPWGDCYINGCSNSSEQFLIFSGAESIYEGHDVPISNLLFFCWSCLEGLYEIHNIGNGLFAYPIYQART